MRVWLYNNFDIPYIKGQNQRKNKPVYILFNHLRDEIKQFQFLNMHMMHLVLLCSYNKIYFHLIWR